MKKSDFIFYSILSILVMSIVVVVIVKFYIIPRSQKSTVIENIDDIQIYNLDGNCIKLNSIIDKSGTSFFVIAKLNDCYGCVLRSINELKVMQKKDCHCFMLIVYDSLDDVKGWSSHEKFSPIYMMTRSDFIKNVNIKSSPALIKTKNGRIANCRYITAN